MNYSLAKANEFVEILSRNLTIKVVSILALNIVT